MLYLSWYTGIVYLMLWIICMCFNVTISNTSKSDFKFTMLLLTSGAPPCMFFLMSHKIRNISLSSGPLTASPTSNFIVKEISSYAFTIQLTISLARFCLMINILSSSFVCRIYYYRIASYR